MTAFSGQKLQTFDVFLLGQCNENYCIATVFRQQRQRFDSISLTTCLFN